MLRRKISLRLICLTVLITLSCLSLWGAYFAFGIVVPWAKDLLWVQAYGNKNLVLFSLEFATLAIIAGILVLTETTFKVSDHEAGSRVTGIEYAFDAAFFITAFGYGYYRITQGDHSTIRLLYAFFSFSLMVVWLRNSIMLGRTYIGRFTNAVARLRNEPESVFAVGRELFFGIGTLSFSATVLLAPLCLLLPTLLPGSFHPRTIAFLVGASICLIILLVLIYAQLQVSQALDQSLRSIDSDIIAKVRKLSSEPEVDQLKQLLDVKNSLASSVKLPATTIIVSVLQTLTILAALIASVRRAGP